MALNTSRSKYGARKTMVGSICFASGKEATRYRELLLLEKAGEITSLTIQPRWDLVVNGVRIGRYTGDFTYFSLPTAQVIVEDVKGVRTRDYVLRKKLMKAIYNIDVVEV